MFIYLIAVFLELVPLYKNKQKKELMIYSLLSGVALVLNLLLILDIKIPSPSLLIQKLVFTLIGGSGEG
jgi:hypothetical protein